MREFYSRVAELLDRGWEFIIAHLVKTIGSAPQRPGAKLIVYPDGATEFTIGGGTLEVSVTEEALRLSRSSGPMVKEYELRALGMHCGGAVKVLYDALSGSEEERQFYHRARELLEQGQRFVIAHLIGTNDKNPKLLVFADGAVESLGGEVPPQLREAISKEARALLSSGSASGRYLSYPETELFLELVEGPPRLLIFGAGHVGAKLAELAAAIGGFRVEVVDDRAEFLDKLKPFADKVHKVEPGYRGRLPLPDERTFVAIITRSHETDKAVLQRILREGRPPAYLGVIGSIKKRAELFRMLIKEGIAEERLAQVHTPIGLPIGGKEPGEIAVSALAEIIKVKNGLEEG
ncbi:MAG: XdhC family protein [Candidatus Bipolaricaulia bacterium]